jgi:hypothetical protein
MLYDIVRQKIDEFAARNAAVLKNPELSKIGQKNAFDRVKADIVAYTPRALEILTDDMNMLRIRFKQNNAARAKAQDAAEAAWDYQRLNYHVELVRAFIAKTISTNSPGLKLSVTEIFINEWNQVLTYGDKVKMRAWAEFGADELKRVLPADPAMIDLANSMAKKLGELLYTPALKAADDLSDPLAKEALALVNVINQAAACFYPPEFTDPWLGGMPKTIRANTPGFGPRDPFTKLLDGVSINTVMLEFDPKFPDRISKITVTIEDVKLTGIDGFSLDPAIKPNHGIGE